MPVMRDPRGGSLFPALDFMPGAGMAGSGAGLLSGAASRFLPRQVLTNMPTYVGRGIGAVDQALGAVGRGGQRSLGYLSSLASEGRLGLAAGAGLAVGAGAAGGEMYANAMNQPRRPVVPPIRAIPGPKAVSKPEYYPASTEPGTSPPFPHDTGMMGGALGMMQGARGMGGDWYQGPTAPEYPVEPLSGSEQEAYSQWTTPAPPPWISVEQMTGPESLPGGGTPQMPMPGRPPFPHDTGMMGGALGMQMAARGMAQDPGRTFSSVAPLTGSAARRSVYPMDQAQIDAYPTSAYGSALAFEDQLVGPLPDTASKMQYQIQQGDTIGGVAAAILGPGASHQEILDMIEQIVRQNEDVIENEDLIQPKTMLDLTGLGGGGGVPMPMKQAGAYYDPRWADRQTSFEDTIIGQEPDYDYIGSRIQGMQPESMSGIPRPTGGGGYQDALAPEYLGLDSFDVNGSNALPRPQSSFPRQAGSVQLGSVPYQMGQRRRIPSEGMNRPW